MNMQTTATGSTSPQRPRVIAVDVESSGVERVRSILTPAGYDVLPARGTTAALEAVSRHSADLVLLDVERARTVGLAAYRRLREELSPPQFPILMLTPSADRQTRREVMEAGVDDLLTTEPLDPLELKVRVHTLLELKAHREQGGLREVLQDPRTRWVRMERLARVGTLAADLATQMDQLGVGLQRALEHVRARAAQGLPPDSAELLKLGVAGEQMRLHGQHLLSLGPSGPQDIQRFDLREVVPEVVSRLRAAGRLGRADVRAVLPEDPIAVVFNRRQVEQVVAELVCNAVDAVEDVKDRPRVVQVGVELPDMFGEFGPQLFVKDTGIGIFEDELQAIFSPYYTTKAPEKSVGLGLTVARTLVESMGGKLTVKSRVNLGSTFTVELPEQTSSW
ncbi:response regulator [Corallococcus sp. AB049A]|uniref:histidine kinase n=1 Tax=Corallococcus interemptor TaxID=2316720 RepID=A0A3A8QG94_9BACT|nr:hybrid sensor histidine kinase/response regulator [Corallococcus interemptor]RKH49803.1 response regulator [Corallococcus sp. AB050B]RKH66701.1 response regulator [Corallococcus interemptor]RKI59724.1 response regulator [Corallococcus sp. AB049A]